MLLAPHARCSCRTQLLRKIQSTHNIAFEQFRTVQTRPGQTEMAKYTQNHPKSPTNHHQITKNLQKSPTTTRNSHSSTNQHVHCTTNTNNAQQIMKKCTKMARITINQPTCTTNIFGCASISYMGGRLVIQWVKFLRLLQMKPDI